jgi:ribosomal protein S18
MCSSEKIADRLSTNTSTQQQRMLEAHAGGVRVKQLRLCPVTYTAVIVVLLFFN